MATCDHIEYQSNTGYFPKASITAETHTGASTNTCNSRGHLYFATYHTRYSSAITYIFSLASHAHRYGRQQCEDHLAWLDSGTDEEIGSRHHEHVCLSHLRYIGLMHVTL
jgi:hypothetical protein